MSSKSVPSSEDVRQKGNSLYRSGKVSETLLFYRRASELSSEEVAPWSNLSAAYFELGDYTQAISACDTALALLARNVTDSVAAKQKLSTRKKKASFFAGLYAGAETGHADSTDVEVETYSAAIQSYSSAAGLIEDPIKARQEVVSNLPRYKPTINEIPEYYVIGHDTPESLFDASLSSSPRQRLSFLFGGIGVARNLFQTIIEIADHERKSKKKEAYKDYHFTVVDIKPPAIARDLVVLFLLDELSALAHDPAKAKSSKVLQCLFYTYVSSIMPSDLQEMLQDKIGEAKNALEKSALPPFIEIPDLYRADVVRYLDEWQRNIQQKFPVDFMRSAIVKARAQEEMQRRSSGLPSEFADFPPCMAKEQQFEAQIGALILPPLYSKSVCPALREACDAFDKRGPRSATQKAVMAIQDNWLTNPTLIDLAWQHSRAADPYVDFDVGENPCRSSESISGKALEHGFRPRGAMSQWSLFEAPAHWFISLAQALKQTRDRIKIEACVGDITAILEQIKYGVVGHRKSCATPEPHAETAQGTYPQLYDRIHLSNVPDYVGGTLTSYLYALQMTHLGPTSYVTSTCLLNPPRFDSVADFDAEYVALHKDSDLEKLFHVRMKPHHDEFMPMCAYNQWYHRTVSREYKHLMPRSNLYTWLYRLFFKIALPIERRNILDDGQPLYSPLNLTYFFRLCTHLHSIGYPAHWLSEIVSSLLSGTVTTTARPPRSETLKPRELMTQSVAPFTAELSTLAAMWQLLLPFGILSSDIAPLDTLRRYSVTLASTSQEINNLAVFILVFHKGALPLTPRSSLRKALLSDEKGSEEHRHFCEQRVAILSTWTWHQPSRTATFWLRADVMQKMKAEGWRVCLFRTDNWRPQSDSYNVDKVKDTGVRWVDQVNGKV